MIRLQTVAARCTLVSLISFISAFACAQSRTHGPDRLLARLSYAGGHVIDWRHERGNPQICLSLYRSGYYRVARLTEGGTETLQGTLSRDQVTRFRSVLENLDFQSSGGAVIRNGAEVLVAEVVRKGRTMHYVWIDPDHERPFPSSAMSVVKWLQEFNPEGGLPLSVRELSDEPSICPVASESVLPLAASLHPVGAGSSCLQP
jgi:hypothetical protein